MYSKYFLFVLLIGLLCIHYYKIDSRKIEKFEPTEITPDNYEQINTILAQNKEKHIEYLTTPQENFVYSNINEIFKEYTVLEEIFFTLDTLINRLTYAKLIDFSIDNDNPAFEAQKDYFDVTVDQNSNLHFKCLVKSKENYARSVENFSIRLRNPFDDKLVSFAIRNLGIEVTSLELKENIVSPDSSKPYVYYLGVKFSNPNEISTFQDFLNIFIFNFIKTLEQGCTDSNALNYDPDATKDDGSCYYKNGCTDSEALNYDSEADNNDGSCYYKNGCTDSDALNYDPDADNDDGSCEYIGCTDSEALNYDPDADKDDGSCYYKNGCMDSDALNYDPDADNDDGSCEYKKGCMDSDAFNYDEDATKDDGSCEYENGCTDSDALNYDRRAYKDDGSCYYKRGCTDSEALNYDPDADNDDGSCYYKKGCTDSEALNYDRGADKDDGSCKYPFDIEIILLIGFILLLLIGLLIYFYRK